MIDPALVLLARLRLGAWLRRLRRGMSTKRGVAFFIIGALVFMMWLLPALIAAVAGADLPRSRTDPQSVRNLMPLFLLGVTLMMALFSGGKSISFTPAEIDFLFPGPFSRRQLVLWKIAIGAFGAIWLALFLSVWQVRSASIWIAAFIGLWLSLVMAQTFAMLLLLVRQALKPGRASPVVRTTMFALLALLALAVIDVLRPMLALLRGTGATFDDVIAQQRQSLPARVVLAPFDVLTLTFTAERLYPDLLVWSAVSSATIALVVWLILRLEDYFIETSLGASAAVHAAVQRYKRSGNPFGGTAKPLTSARLPMLPWLGGTGPVAWRQMMAAARGARGLALVLLLMVLGLGPFLWIVAARDTVAIPLLVVAAFWMVFLLPSMLRFDFRGDLAHIEDLKLLPIAPSMIAVGQMLAPALALFLLAAGVTVIVMVIAPQQALIPGLIALAYLPPMAFLLIGIENAAFLLFPTAQTMSTPGDLTMMGRAMVVMFLKAAAMAAVLCVIAGLGGATLALSQSWPIALVVAWMALAATASAIVPVVARLFERFDPSVDRPAE